MNRYQPPMHRPAFAVAAVAMTVLTLGLSVVAPAKLASLGQDARTLAGPNPVTRAPTEIAAHPARIEVIGVREQNTAFEPVREVSRNPKQQG